MLIFSLVTLQRNNEKAVFLVGGTPITTSDLKNYTAYEKFVKSDETVDTMGVVTYGYGEGEKFDASPAEVAYMDLRLKRHSQNDSNPYCTCNPFFVNSCCLLDQEFYDFKKKVS